MLLCHFSDALLLSDEAYETVVTAEGEAEPSSVLVEPCLTPTKRKRLVADCVHLGHGRLKNFFSERMVSIRRKNVRLNWAIYRKSYVALLTSFAQKIGAARF
jgi:hypothetical protein